MLLTLELGWRRTQNDEVERAQKPFESYMGIKARLGFWSVRHQWFFQSAQNIVLNLVRMKLNNADRPFPIAQPLVRCKTSAGERKKTSHQTSTEGKNKPESVSNRVGCRRSLEHTAHN